MHPTKVFTCITAFRLSEQSRSRLDKIVISDKTRARQLFWFPGASRSSTIRRLIDAEFQKIIDARSAKPPTTVPKRTLKKPLKRKEKK